MKTLCNCKSRDVISEFLGTFMLVMIGVGSISVNEISEVIGNFGIALSFGLAVYFCINLFSASSGAHLNPVVTLIFYLIRTCSLRSTVSYILAQLLGASAAAVCLKAVFGHALLAGVTRVHSDVSLYNAFFIEGIMTFFLIMSILTTRNATIISIAVFLDAFIGGPLTGASMNPARSFGPAFAMGYWDNQWLYWCAPLCGGLAAVFCCHFIMQDPKTVSVESR
ncbi:aquaporin [Pantoea agglomerans]|uniref:MIP/aquaporin family protein n=1 Tax=Pantoea TaxID=53335 RepID=UPI0015FA282F|nr:aquaporin [Pantoea agglomerans]WEC75208.1 aquaporin [Pantoea agglomerans]WNK38000.1 aquaporin [Pantoea agglomerans]WNK56186.1 aquaporin [Pantoea agglomerans]WNK74139.1 aquaporin [Pantoea agglomerans]